MFKQIFKKVSDFIFSSQMDKFDDSSLIKKEPIQNHSIEDITFSIEPKEDGSNYSKEELKTLFIDENIQQSIYQKTGVKYGINELVDVAMKKILTNENISKERVSELINKQNPSETLKSLGVNMSNEEIADIAYKSLNSSPKNKTTQKSNFDNDKYMNQCRYESNTKKYVWALEEKTIKNITNEKFNTARNTAIEYLNKPIENYYDYINKHFFLLNITKHLYSVRKTNETAMNLLIELYNKDIDIFEKFKSSTIKNEIEQHSKSKEEAIAYFNKLSFPAFINLSNIYTWNNEYDKAINVIDLALSKKYYNDCLQEKKGEILAKRSKENQDFTAITVNTDKITTIIEVKKSGQKGKFGFIDSKGIECSTEDAFKDYYQNDNYKVMRGEVNFWQAMFCLAFFEEIFSINTNPHNDIPIDLFNNEKFYEARKKLIDNKFEYLKQVDLYTFINKQVEQFGKTQTRLLYNGGIDNIAYIKSKIVQSFLKRIDNKTFAEVVYKIAQNPNENRAGVADFVVWNKDKLVFIETKKMREKIRDSQLMWIDFMLNNEINIEIVRLKGV